MVMIIVGVLVVCVVIVGLVGRGMSYCMGHDVGGVNDDVMLLW